MTNFSLLFVADVSGVSQGLLNRWTLQLDLGSTTGWLERVVSVLKGMQDKKSVAYLRSD